MSPLNNETREQPNLGLHCPQCGAPSGNEISAMVAAGKFAAVPRSNYLLLSFCCGHCRKDFDVAFWAVPPAAIPEHRDSNGLGYDDALRRRFENTVEQIAATAGETFLCDSGVYEIKGGCNANLAFVSAATAPVVIPLEALALARGVRRAALQDQSQFFRCTIGTLNLSLGISGVSPSYGMQLSVFDGGAAGPISDFQLQFALSLVFTVAEAKQSHELRSEFASERVREVIVPLPSFYLENSRAGNPPTARKAS